MYHCSAEGGHNRTEQNFVEFREETISICVKLRNMNSNYGKMQTKFYQSNAWSYWSSRNHPIRVSPSPSVRATSNWLLSPSINGDASPLVHFECKSLNFYLNNNRKYLMNGRKSLEMNRSNGLAWLTLVRERSVNLLELQLPAATILSHSRNEPTIEHDDGRCTWMSA